MLDGRVKTLHPAIHGGLLADRRNPEHVRQLAEHGIEPFDLVVVESVPVPRDGRERRRARGRDRADRHRRASDGARRREELRVGRRGGRSGALRRPARRARRRGRAHARHAPMRWRPPRSRTPPPTTPRSQRGSPSRAPTTSCRPSWVSPTRRSATCATARTRISAGPSTGKRRRPDRSAVPGCCRARRCRSTTGSTPRRRTRSPPRCPRIAVVIVKHNNPCGAAARGSLAEAYRARVRLRQGERVRWHRRVPRRGRRRGGGGDARGVHRGRHRAVVHARGARGVR